MLVTTICALFLVALISGCISVDPEDIVRNSPVVKKFLEEYPNAEVKVTYYSIEEASAIIDTIKSDCEKEFVTPKEFYRVTITDEGSGLSVVAWVDWRNQIVECATKKGEKEENETVCYPHERFNCYDGHVYWYDSCGNREEKKEYCENGCEDGKCNPPRCRVHHEYKCYGDHVYWYDSCGNREEKKEYCVSGCEDGECKPSETNKTCTDSDGGYDIYERGTAVSGSQKLTDHCNSDGTLTEKFCAGGEIKGESVECPDGHVCDGGKCVAAADECTEHKEAKCYEGHVYWYDSCGNREKKKEYCEYGCDGGECIEQEAELNRSDFFNEDFVPHLILDSDTAAGECNQGSLTASSSPYCSSPQDCGVYLYIYEFVNESCAAEQFADVKEAAEGLDLAGSLHILGEEVYRYRQGVAISYVWQEGVLLFMVSGTHWNVCEDYMEWMVSRYIPGTECYYGEYETHICNIREGEHKTFEVMGEEYKTEAASVSADAEEALLKVAGHPYVLDAGSLPMLITQGDMWFNVTDIRAVSGSSSIVIELGIYKESPTSECYDEALGIDEFTQCRFESYNNVNISLTQPYTIWVTYIDCDGSSAIVRVGGTYYEIDEDEHKHLEIDDFLWIDVEDIACYMFPEEEYSVRLTISNTTTETIELDDHYTFTKDGGTYTIQLIGVNTEGDEAVVEINSETFDLEEDDPVTIQKGELEFKVDAIGLIKYPELTPYLLLYDVMWNK
jgi:hypothetical protein